MKILFRFFVFLLCTPAFAQFTVTPNNSADALAQAIAGSGLTVSNASLVCGMGASGTFDYSGSGFPIEKGVILCTGVIDSIGKSGSYFCSTANGISYSDPNLLAIEPTASHDVCLLQFDVVAMFPNININFVFGSEEYPEFVNSGYNDAFGFFLTGPNPAGGSYTGTNIGALPNGVAVSINNVNASVNSFYFHDNYTSPDSMVAYDGFTTVITSTVPVVANYTYHMKIAIADAADEIYDSGIFIQDSLFISKPYTTGLTSFSEGNIHLSPNPARDIVHIEMPADGATSVEIYTLTGQKTSAKFSTTENTIDVSGLANGVYTIQLRDKIGNVFTTKFVKE